MFSRNDVSWQVNGKVMVNIWSAILLPSSFGWPEFVYCQLHVPSCAPLGQVFSYFPSTLLPNIYEWRPSRLKRQEREADHSCQSSRRLDWYLIHKVWRLRRYVSSERLEVLTQRHIAASQKTWSSRDTVVRNHKSCNFATYKEMTSYYLSFFGLFRSSFLALRMELLKWTLYKG